LVALLSSEFFFILESAIFSKLHLLSVAPEPLAFWRKKLEGLFLENFESKFSVGGTCFFSFFLFGLLIVPLLRHVTELLHHIVDCATLGAGN